MTNKLAQKIIEAAAEDKPYDIKECVDAYLKMSIKETIEENKEKFVEYLFTSEPINEDEKEEEVEENDIDIENVDEELIETILKELGLEDAEDFSDEDIDKIHEEYKRRYDHALMNDDEKKNLTK